jgi:uracil phosphoribosyltransferase
MTMHVLNKEPSVASNFIAELRDIHVQKDALRFRRNLERLGEIMAYRISEVLDYKLTPVQTPLAIAEEQVLAEQPILCTILRAGLPFHQGFMNYFDAATSAFVAAYRVEASQEIAVHVDYLVAPDLQDKVLILVDPMLATGKSLALAYQALLRFGKPRHTHIAAAIASPEGVRHIQNTHPDITLWLGALDEKLNEHAYIVPGLGDAGDLAFGTKL